MKRFLSAKALGIFGGVVAVLLIAVGARVWLHLKYVDAPLQLDRDYILMVEQGSNLRRVLNRLESEGIIPSALDLRVFLRLNKEQVRLQAGEYLLTANLSGRTLLQKFARGDMVYHQVQLIEGWTLDQALAVIQQHEAVKSVLQDATDLQEQLNLENPPEGQFFPDTYRFVRGTTDLELLRQANQLMTSELENAWAERDAGLPYATPYELLTMASIIEKETGLASERTQISGVFVRRLQQGMRLQTDPTVIYGVGRAFDGNLTRLHLQTDTPWNTYTREGLPPTPIALPGRASLLASAHPENGNALFFVSKGDGSHQFSATLQEHNDAVRRYQQGGR